MESFNRLGGMLIGLTVRLAVATMVERVSCCDWQVREHICVTCTVLMIDSLRLFHIGFMGIEFLKASVTNAMKEGDHWVDWVD